jgi:hypothetical protein
MQTAILILTCLALISCVATMPNTGIYENPVRRNHRQQYLAQNPQLPSNIRQAIASQQVISGMSRTDVMASWGAPKSCSRVFASPQERTVCLYTDTTRSVVLDRTYRDTDYKSVYFESGRVVDWQLH